MQLPELDIDISHCLTPKKREILDTEEEQLLSEDSERSQDNDVDSASDSDGDDEPDQDEKILQKDEAMKKRELDDIKAFAKANGFDCIIEDDKVCKPFVMDKAFLDAQ